MWNSTARDAYAAFAGAAPPSAGFDSAPFAGAAAATACFSGTLITDPQFLHRTFFPRELVGTASTLRQDKLGHMIRKWSLAIATISYTGGIDR